MKQGHDKQRRKVVMQVISATTLALVAGSGLLMPQRLLAHWPREAFNAKTIEDALLALVGEAEPLDDDSVRFTVGSPPSYAVNGASVPVELETSLAHIERVIILVEKNPQPLAMVIEPTEHMVMPFKSMIKIAEDSDVFAVVRADGQLFVTSRSVRIDVGGCA